MRFLGPDSHLTSTIIEHILIPLPSFHSVSEDGFALSVSVFEFHKHGCLQRDNRYSFQPST